MPYQDTIDHQQIRAWVERHGGQPAIVRGTASDTNFGTLRLDFHRHPDLEQIHWNEFFDRFESLRLAFRYRDPEDSDDQQPPEDRFKLINRDEAELTSPPPDTGDPDVRRQNRYASAPDKKFWPDPGSSSDSERS